MRNPTIVIPLFLLTARILIAQELPQDTNPLVNRLIRQGIELEDGLAFRLPTPKVLESLEPEAQKKVITELAGRYGYSTFVRRSAVAPFMLKQTYLKDGDGRRVGHAIGIWFIAYGRLEDFQDKELAKELAGTKPGDDDGSMRQLSNEELASCQIELPDDDSEGFVVAEAPLMNRVHVRSVIHAIKTNLPGTITVGWELDGRFDRNAELANRWWPIETTNLGERKRGDPQPYHGYGGYLKITQLTEPADALLFETHVVFHEPENWFRGSNFLRSKTPLIVKENVDRLRRRLRNKKSETKN